MSQPRAFRVTETGTYDDRGANPLAGPVVITEEPLDAIEAADGVPVLVERRRRAPWASLLVAALGGLVSLGVGLAIERLVADLFAAAPWLGWTALALTALAVLALLGLVGRELRGVFRERHIEALRRAAADAIAVRDAEGAKTVARDLAALYAGRTTTLAGPSIASIADEIMDADDRLAFAERTLVEPLDAQAQRAIASAAKRVSAVTAFSPRAIVDVAFVLYTAASLLRRIAAIYGGRPGLFGLLRLFRAAINHLAVTGGVAIGDGLLHQALGVGLAARVSAKLGEGMLNGIMTARFGLAALDVCRPLPFIRTKPPKVSDVVGDLLPGRNVAS